MPADQSPQIDSPQSAHVGRQLAIHIEWLFINKLLNFKLFRVGLQILTINLTINS